MMKNMKEENSFEIFKKVDGFWELKPYCAENMIAGDTDSSMFSLHHVFQTETDIEEVVGFADEVGKRVNDSFPEYVEAVFNCPEERKHTIKTDREIVADASLFVTKKRYIMRIQDKEGERKESLKIMGLEIKKSDTSKAVKEFLKELAVMMLEGNDYEKIRESIEEFKSTFFHLSFFDLGIPKPTKKLKEYQEHYERTGSLKHIPYHVRAAMFYNSMCGKRDQPIRVGDKFLLCYVKHPKSKYMGIPIDMNELPEWVKEIPIDYETEWQKAEVKINNYLKSLGWDEVSRKKKKAAMLFGV